MNFPVATASKLARRTVGLREQTEGHLATVFAIPKPFTDEQTALIQRNAILSWQRLAPEIDVLLMGDEVGVAAFAQEHGLRHIPDLRRNRHGTPLLSDAFALAHAVSTSPILIYCNSDVMLLRDLLTGIELIRRDNRFASFLAFGRREDLKIARAFDLCLQRDVDELLDCRRTQGRRAPVVCKEYFVFTRDLYPELPEFSVGRGNWDNWMVAHARDCGVPVINASQIVSAVHQSHDYRHLKTSRWGCYVACPEARENERLAGGRHLARGCVANWNLTSRGIVPNRGAWFNKDFWLDLPNFLRMLVKLPFER